MDSATIFVFVLAIGFAGFIVYLSILSRKQQDQKDDKPKSRKG